MNLEQQEKRLEEVFRKNNNKGFAVAITGSWGIGKTHFWKNFLEKKLSEERLHRNEKIFNRKYAYVSLFGIESLSDLKTEIYSNIENNHSSIEVPKWLKGLPSIFKDTRISQLGISAPAKLIDTLMFSQVKDAIICFDDFERLSEKLKIQDVMGLANQLKLERKCQVILILDESKNDEENKKKYAEYKEKLIDETIKVTSVESLIREKAKDIDKTLLDLMVKFADELGIHNFRFFQKVIKLYRQFRAKLPNEVAYSTKEVILIRILQGFLIEEFGEVLDVKWQDFNLDNAYEILENTDDQSLNDIKIRTFNKLENISYALVSSSDAWFGQFKNWFEQKDQWNEEILDDLANSELISEEINNLKENRTKLWKMFWDNQLDENLIVELYEKTNQLIGVLEIEDLAFTCDILNVLESDRLAYQLKAQIYRWINAELNKNIDDFIDKFTSFRQSKNCFYNYIDKYKIKNLYVGLPNLLEVTNAYVINRAWNSKHVRSLEVSSKDDWKKLLFEQIPNNGRFSHYNSSLIATKMVNQSMKPELNAQIRNTIIEVYQEKGQESDFYNKYMNYLISRLDN